MTFGKRPHRFARVFWRKALRGKWGIAALAGVIGAAAVCFGICLGSKRWLKVVLTGMTSCRVKKGRCLRILHITDLHGNSAKRMNLDIWPAVQKLDVDMAVITGDVIVNDISELVPHRHGLANLARRVPVFFVDGNHEKFYTKECRRFLERIGINVLYNEKRRLDIAGIPLTVVGFRDYTFLKNGKFQDIDMVLHGLDRSRFTLVLSHQPQLFPRLAEHQPDLVLAGHTHGGQVRLPFLPVLYAPGQGCLPKYGYGWYTLGFSRLYVSKGIGATHFPIRFWNRPELTVIHVHGKDNLHFNEQNRK